MRIIIENLSHISTPKAIERVADVIRAGRVSEASGIKQYCFITTYRDGVEVYTRRKRSVKSADSFLIINK